MWSMLSFFIYISDIWSEPTSVQPTILHSVFEEVWRYAEFPVGFNFQRGGSQPLMKQFTVTEPSDQSQMSLSSFMPLSLCLSLPFSLCLYLLISCHTNFSVSVSTFPSTFMTTSLPDFSLLLSFLLFQVCQLVFFLFASPSPPPPSALVLPASPPPPHSLC